MSVFALTTTSATIRRAPLTQSPSLSSSLSSHLSAAAAATELPHRALRHHCRHITTIAYDTSNVMNAKIRNLLNGTANSNLQTTTSTRSAADQFKYEMENQTEHVDLQTTTFTCSAAVHVK